MNSFAILTPILCFFRMARSSDTSPRKCAEVKTLLLNTKHSQRVIAALAGVSKSVVNRIKKKIYENVPLEADRNGKCGRKRITTPRTDRKIRDVCLQNRKKSVSFLTLLINEGGIKVSQRTVQRRLAEEGLVGYRPAKKPRLTAAMTKKRLEWAKAHQHMTIEDWNKVINIIVVYKLLKNSSGVIIDFSRCASLMSPFSKFWWTNHRSSDDARERNSTRTALWRRLNTLPVSWCGLSSLPWGWGASTSCKGL